MLASLLEADHFVRLFQRMLIWSGARKVVAFTVDRRDLGFWVAEAQVENRIIPL